ncbi:MAG TPA: hypothetical protein VMV62_02785 [Candidatus Paceibacterota bacterium]|nr:hypothetical protein [Candidatus Paceibacterota bacterium]
MITDTDITRLTGVFATKMDLTDVRTELKEDIADIHVELGEMRDTIDTMASAIGRIENALDGIAGAIQDQRTENAAGAVHLARHDRQIDALALATHVTLPD